MKMRFAAVPADGALTASTLPLRVSAPSVTDDDVAAAGTVSREGAVNVTAGRDRV